MNPNDLQNLLNAQQQAVHQAQSQMYFFGYATFAAIIICALFSVLIFLKLRDIAGEFLKFRITYEMAEDRKARAAKTTPPRVADESR